MQVIWKIAGGLFGLAVGIGGLVTCAMTVGPAIAAKGGIAAVVGSIALLVVGVILLVITLVSFFSLFPEHELTGRVVRVAKEKDEDEFTIGIEAGGVVRSFGVAEPKFRKGQEVQIIRQGAMWTVIHGASKIRFGPGFQFSLGA